MSRDWEQAYKEGETPWDKGYASPALCEFLKGQPVRGRVLVPGCGTGHDVRALAAQGADVTGLDIAESALRRAEAFPKVCGEAFLAGDFLDLGREHWAAYDWVFEHTCLCALDPAQRAAYAYSVRKALKPKGQYLAVFFREVEDYTGAGPPHPISREVTDALFGDAFERLQSTIPTEFYPSRPYGAEELCWMRLR